ncbi:unnamed protein product [Didymodactylos carnosus]|uniref:RING-type E3 ubiquitin transferase n=1 Tax=Didymodactylos carnosus TaxID=1234261 RepID=A0A815MRU2_9BILA|nr:unnamed protein product [Didymodactylos carnosus]CAF1424334.1 unnamed protein product [Didymodactylos carnosus]CAF4037255.1 unnamed protein product [Didymodactylos carnosus]CAF4305755.1 unnamed protein product [Didymodactylos carnosus]
MSNRKTSKICHNPIEEQFQPAITVPRTESESLESETRIVLSQVSPFVSQKASPIRQEVTTSTYECCICFENIYTSNKQFGIQNNCDHLFCFDCILTWRKSNFEVARKCCPLCRKKSTFIAPSWRWFSSDSDKRTIIDSHKIYLKSIPCRTLSHYGQCRFGNKCYYNHSSIASRRYITIPSYINSPSSSTNNQQLSSYMSTLFYTNYAYNYASTTPYLTSDSMNDNNDDYNLITTRRTKTYRYHPY